MSLQGLTEIMGDARGAMSDEAFQKAGSALSENKNNIREEIQAKTATEIRTIIYKLKDREAISPPEMDLIRLWIVGDADNYVKMENNFRDWMNEFGRLENVLKDYESKDCSSEELFKVHGILEDAVRVCYDIANFLEKKERIEKFEAAAADGLDADERDILVEVLTNKLESLKY